MATFSERLNRLMVKIFGSRNEREIKAMLPMVAEITRLEPGVERLSDTELRNRTSEFRDRLSHGETLDDLLPEAFAVVREASRRVVWTPDARAPRPMRHFDVQMLGGIVLHRGLISEMVTGEGKTLVATLAAYLNALPEGKSVHVVTVNDFLARRDCAWMGPMFQLLDMRTGAIQSQQGHAAKEDAYACDVTYGTASEFGFDYLRDNMRVDAEQQMQRCRHFAIVDEVDSVLIDEARTPLIISGPSEESTEKYYEADRIARRLRKGVHYTVKEKENQASLTEEGVGAVERHLGVDSIYAGRNQEWPHHIEQSLRAHELYKRDVQYVVKGNEIIIVDEFTGRLQPGRRWSDGLHQAIEAKEHLKIKEENQTLATITYQNYFRLYEKLAGMTGTAVTEAAEFMKIYGLDVICLPTNQPLIRKEHRDVIFRTGAEKFDAIEEEVVEQHATGRPILVGTISIERSEMLSEGLKRRGIKHEVLNAKHHEREAQIVAQAGQMGHVTIATNMAGRGTDIVLGRFSREEILEYWQACGLAPKNINGGLSDEEMEERLLEHWAEHYLDAETLAKTPRERRRQELEKHWRDIGLHPLQLCESVSRLGGLHIIGTERHEARRIDNQLRGRAGRQGDPGSSRFFLSLEDDLMRIFAPEWVSSILERVGMRDGMAIEHGMVTRRIAQAQKKVEEHNFEIRKHLLEYDEVPNEQRRAIYAWRQRALTSDNLRPEIERLMEQGIEDAVDRWVSSDQPPEERSLRPLNDWLRRFDVEFPAEEWRDRSQEELARRFVEGRSDAGGDREAIAQRFVEESMRLFCPNDVVFAEWKLTELHAWAQGAGLGDLSEHWREHLEDTITRTVSESAGEELGGADAEDMLRRLVSYAMETFLPSDVGFDEWDFDGLGEWAGELRLSLPVSQWRRRGPSEQDLEEGRDPRGDLETRIRERLRSGLRQREAKDVFTRLVGFELRRAFRRMDTEEGEASYRPIVRWLSRSMDVACGEETFEGIAEEERAGAAARLVRKLLENFAKRSDAELAAFCWESLFNAFLEEDLSASGRDFVLLSGYAFHKYGVRLSPFDLSRLDIESVGETIRKAVLEAYDRHEQSIAPENMRLLERFLLLEKIDTKWKEHLYNMDQLKGGIGLRGYAQLDPKVEYAREARQMFDEMRASIGEEVTELILKLRPPGGGEELAAGPRDVWGGGEAIHPSAPVGLDSAMRQQQEAAIAGSQRGAGPRPIVTGERIGRNAPCTCGSGKKYKKCCGRKA